MSVNRVLGNVGSDARGFDHLTSNVGQTLTASDAAINTNVEGGHTRAWDNSLAGTYLKDKVLRAEATSTGAAWPSTGWTTHQNSVQRVLSNSLSKHDMKTLQKAVGDADASKWQTVEYSYRHAMTPAGMSKEDARQKSNDFVRSELNFARQLEAAGKRDEAMYHLGMAMHCLQDATSPAHQGFREYKGGNVEYAEHVYEELFDPGRGSHLDEATKRAYMYFKGTLEMPQDFFSDLGYDTYKK